MCSGAPHFAHHASLPVVASHPGSAGLVFGAVVIYSRVRKFSLFLVSLIIIVPAWGFFLLFFRRKSEKTNSAVITSL